LSPLIVSETATCPGLFYATSTKDGQLFRIRIPGGILTERQCFLIAEVAENLADGCLQVTNRSNLQLRTKLAQIPTLTYHKLQKAGLAAQNPVVDHLRNIMVSPTAGIDRTQLIDTRPLMAELTQYIDNSPHLANLPPKFSFGFAGGEKVAIVDRTNEFLLAAEVLEAQVYLRLWLNAGKGSGCVDTGILLTPDRCLPIAKAAIDVYLTAQENLAPYYQKPRLQQILEHWGLDGYLDRVLSRLDFLPLRLTSSLPNFDAENRLCTRIGIHPQGQKGLFYLGINLSFGNLEARQIRSLGHLARIYGRGELRLTPWQNLLIGDVPEAHLADFQREINDLGLNCLPSSPEAGIVACAGNTGCAKSATDTKAHAMKLGRDLAAQNRIDRPAANIHFTGCPKSCAQTHQADLTLVGTTITQENTSMEAYHIYARGGEDSRFGRLVAPNIPHTAINQYIVSLLECGN
jgi:ferredoxin-nitrite reductase